MVTVYIKSIQFYTLWDYVYIYTHILHHILLGTCGRSLFVCKAFQIFWNIPTVLHFPQVLGLSRNLLPFRNTEWDMTKDSHLSANSDHQPPHQPLHSEITGRVVFNKVFSKCFPAHIKKTSLQLVYLMRHLLPICFLVSHLSLNSFPLSAKREEFMFGTAGCRWGGCGIAVGKFPAFRPTVHLGNRDCCKGSEGWKLSGDRD